MSFIGIFTDNKNYTILKTEILKRINEKNMNIMKINKKNLESMKNIRFDAIVMNDSLKNLDGKMQYLEKIINNTQYLIINSDVDFKYNEIIKEKINIITYGLNQKATITVSSIEENYTLVAIQREIQDIYNNIIEVKEEVLEFKKDNKLKLENQLIIYIIVLIFKEK